MKVKCLGLSLLWRNRIKKHFFGCDHFVALVFIFLIENVAIIIIIERCGEKKIFALPNNIVSGSVCLYGTFGGYLLLRFRAYRSLVRKFQALMCRGSDKCVYLCVALTSHDSCKGPSLPYCQVFPFQSCLKTYPTTWKGYLGNRQRLIRRVSGCRKSGSFNFVCPMWTRNCDDNTTMRVMMASCWN